MRAGLTMLLLLLAGCRTARTGMDRALMADQGGAGRNRGVAEHYAVHCPDVLIVAVAGRGDESGLRPVGSDGRIELGGVGRLRVEGKSVPETGELIAAALGEERGQVQVAVAGYRSQQIYLFGPGVGPQRSLAYEGQETVLDVLQRAGGIKPGAAPNHVYVVRPHLGEGKPPEVFHIALRDILEKHDERTNLRLQPFDEVHVGETRKASFEKYVPPIFRPLYESLCGLSRRWVVGIRDQGLGIRDQRRVRIRNPNP